MFTCIEFGLGWGSGPRRVFRLRAYFPLQEAVHLVNSEEEFQQLVHDYFYDDILFLLWKYQSLKWNYILIGLSIYLLTLLLVQPESDSSLRRHVAASLIQYHRAIERNGHALQPVSPASYSSSMEVIDTLPFPLPTIRTHKITPRRCGENKHNEYLRNRIRYPIL